MFKRKRMIVPVTLFLVTVLLLAGCAQAATSSTTTVTGVGNVTEITVVTTVNATGTIAPLRLASVTWKTSGTVAEVKAQVGQAVLTDDILMSLNPVTVPDSLVTALQNLAEMTSPASIATAQQAVLTAEQNVTDAKDASNNLTYWYDEKAYQDKVAAMVLAQANLDAAQTAYDQVSGLPADDTRRAMSYQNLYNAQTAFKTAQYYVNLYSEKPAQTSLDTASVNLALVEAKLEEAKNYLAALTGGDVPADATGSSLQQLNQTRRTVDELNLRAPFDGTVGALYNQSGDVVATNAVSAVVMDRSKLFVTVQVEESKVVQLVVGDKAAVTLEALPSLSLTGKVIAIDPVGVASQGVVYYSVKVELDQVDPQIPLDATADVTITAGDAKQELAVPVAAVQSDSTGEYVLVYAADGSTTRVDVVSGLIQADDTVVVTGNLKVGDQVMLVQSAATTSNDTGNGPRGGGGIFGP
jgi:multidrug efflux pump subunit AcrA (membrane-fusion protein)